MEKNELFDRYKGLVNYAYSQYLQKHLCLRSEKQDFMQVGYMGLWKACLGYQPKGLRSFKAYALRIIKRELHKYWRKNINHFLTLSLDAVKG